MSDGPALWLGSASLLSKWGFDDGYMPDDYLDWCDAHGHPYPPSEGDLLVTLVRTRLVPVLDQKVDIVEIETSHNPIRAERVDGVDVTECWYNRQPAPELTPDGVYVPYADILAIYREAAVAS